MAARKGQRPRDDRGRFVPKDEEEAEAQEDEPKPSAQEDERGGREEIDVSGISAPSIGPHTKIEREPPEERLSRHEISDSDAMGLDKRREVVGRSYGPSFAKQATLYGGFIVIVAVLAIGFKLLADELDKPPETVKAEAPWTTNDIEPAPIDFPRNGNPELTIEPGGRSQAGDEPVGRGDAEG